MNSEEDIEKAKKIVKKKKGFYSHLQAYIVVNTVFLFVAGFSWRYTILFWGIGLASHYYSVFGMPGTGQGSNDWESKELERELKKMDKNKRYTSKPSDRVDLDEKLDLKEIERRYNDNDFV